MNVLKIRDDRKCTRKVRAEDSEWIAILTESLTGKCEIDSVAALSLVGESAKTDRSNLHKIGRCLRALGFRSVFTRGGHVYRRVDWLQVITEAAEYPEFWSTLEKFIESESAVANATP